MSAPVKDMRDVVFDWSNGNVVSRVPRVMLPCEMLPLTTHVVRIAIGWNHMRVGGVTHLTEPPFVMAI